VADERTEPLSTARKRRRFASPPPPQLDFNSRGRYLILLSFGWATGFHRKASLAPRRAIEARRRSLQFPCNLGYAPGRFVFVISWADILQASGRRNSKRSSRCSGGFWIGRSTTFAALRGVPLRLAVHAHLVFRRLRDAHVVGGSLSVEAISLQILV